MLAISLGHSTASSFDGFAASIDRGLKVKWSQKLTNPKFNITLLVACHVCEDITSFGKNHGIGMTSSPLIAHNNNENTFLLSGKAALLTGFKWTVLENMFF